jgi:hypothetical protein
MIVEHAVDPVPDAEVLLVRLDVDIRGDLLDRVGEIRFASLTTGASSTAFSSSSTLGLSSPTTSNPCRRSRP